MSAKVKAKGAYLLRFLFGVLLGLSISANAMTPMSDTQMSDVTGQALLFAQKTVGDGTSTNGTAGLTFYKMGLDGTVNINTNINHMRLGCGGINGTGGCDISIDTMALSGGAGPGSDAVLTRPYVMLAIANDGTPTTRQVVGFDFSAQSASGVLTTGVNGPTANGLNTISGFMIAQSTSACPYGVNVGAVNVAAGGVCIYGSASTAPAVIGGRPCNTYAAPCDPGNGGTGTVLTMNAAINTVGLVSRLSLQTNPNNPGNSGISVPTQTVNFAGNLAVVNGSRLSSTSTNVAASLAPILLPYSALATHPIWCTGVACGLLPAGDLVTFTSDNPGGPPTTSETSVGNYTAGGWAANSCSTYSGSTQLPNCAGNGGSITGLQFAASFSEALGYIHKITVSGAPFSLSFQSQAVLWPGSWDSTAGGPNAGTGIPAVKNIAQPGWWMAFNAPVDLGQLQAANPVDLATAPGVFTQLANVVQQTFNIDGNFVNGNQWSPAYWLCNGTTSCVTANGKSNTLGGGGPLNLGLGQAWSALTTSPSHLWLPIPDISITPGTAVISTVLSNLALSATTQNVPTNCWGAAANTQPCFN